jgi:hypothetical protein
MVLIGYHNLMVGQGFELTDKYLQTAGQSYLKLRNRFLFLPICEFYRILFASKFRLPESIKITGCDFSSISNHIAINTEISITVGRNFSILWNSIRGKIRITGKKIFLM